MVFYAKQTSTVISGAKREGQTDRDRDTQRDRVTNLVFYAEPTSTVISGAKREKTKRERGRENRWGGRQSRVREGAKRGENRHTHTHTHTH